jgi:hypothetical protein
MVKLIPVLLAIALVATDAHAGCTRETGDRYRLMIPSRTGDRGPTATCKQFFATVTLHNPGSLPVSYNVQLDAQRNPTLVSCASRIEIREIFSPSTTRCTGGLIPAGGYEVVDFVLPSSGLAQADAVLSVEWDAPWSVGEPPLEAEVDILPSSANGPNQCPRQHYQLVSEGCR